MSHRLINRNSDLLRLRSEGYDIEVKNGHLLAHHIPYVNSKKEIAFGVLVTPLGDLAGDKTTKPQDHVIHFHGEHPCDKEGLVIKGIQHSSEKKTLVEGVEVDHSFSNKPTDGYPDYYEKIATYAKIISAPAESIDHSVTAKVFRPVRTDNDPDEVFNYLDSNSSRAEIQNITSKLQNLKIAIIGLGGTGSYVLDFVSKTPVKEIHIFDQDGFLSHNAFRAPGAPAIETLELQPKKVAYLHGVYSKMHKYITPHEYHLTAEVSEELSGMDFVFICVDKGESKKLIVDKLEEKKIPFIDVGVGIEAVGGKLTGSVRTTAVTEGKNDHIDKRISFADNGSEDYHNNIQIAELNALNAAFAVIKWKKIFGVYHDFGNEHDSVYSINVNQLINNDLIS